MIFLVNTNTSQHRGPITPYTPPFWRLAGNKSILWIYYNDRATHCTWLGFELKAERSWVQIPARYSGWPGHYNNVGCSARLEISFELNLLQRVNKVTLLYCIDDIKGGVWCHGAYTTLKSKRLTHNTVQLTFVHGWWCSVYRNQWWNVQIFRKEHHTTQTSWKC